MEGLTARGAALRKTLSSDDHAELAAGAEEAPVAPARSPRSHKEKQAAADSKPAAAPEPPKVPLKDQRAHEAGTRRARLILVAVPLALLVWAVYDDVYAQHDDDMDAMNLVVADLTAAADNLDGDGNATVASKAARKRKDASSLMMGLGIDHSFDMNPGGSRVKHARKSLRALVTRSHKAKAKPSGDSKELALKELESVASALKRATTAVRRKTTAGDKDVEHALKAEGITPQVLSGVAEHEHKSPRAPHRSSIAQHSAAARRQREQLRERREARRGTARAVVHRRTQEDKRVRDGG